MGFPEKFLWGAASASAQVEGGYHEDGRTDSIWDAAGKKVKNSETPHVACDHYHKYKEDVAIMKEMGLKSYRFSVSWSRVIPEKGKVNQKGLQFYKNLVAELKNADIEPICTIFHWDMPMWIMNEGGWTAKNVVPYFEEYTRVVVEALSGQVQYWVTINEPQMFIGMGYITGQHAPFKHSVLAINKLSRNALLAHARAVKSIRENAVLKPQVGLAMAAGCYIPNSESAEDLEKARGYTFTDKQVMFGNHWWMDPIVLGTAPDRLKKTLSTKDLEEIHQPIDFIGINVYQPTNYQGLFEEHKTMKPGHPTTAIGWIMEGDALYWTTRFYYERYHLPIMVTENGMANTDFVMRDGKVHDPQRIDFIHNYLKGLKRAVDENLPVLGYQYWSIMDNFEWAEGYGPRFGLVYVDYETLERTIKDSGYDYAEIIRTNGENI